MRITRIYQNQVLAANTRINLDNTAAHHLARVLRLKPGYTIHLFDGKGHEFVGQIAELSKHQVSVDLQHAITPIAESPLFIHLGQAISRGNKMDTAIQKAVELGVSEITPIISEHCAIKLSSDRLAKKMSHWQAIIINACEQCGRAQLPHLNTPCAIHHWLQPSSADHSLVLVPGASKHLSNISPQPHSVRLLIGPEGGLSGHEIEQALSHHFTAISLGPRILRTETAALTAISLLQYCWGDVNQQFSL